MAAGVKLKPGMLRKKESGKFQIIAGFQRITVLLEIYGPDYEVEFWVYDEGFPNSQAVEVAIEDNGSHGRPLSSKDRRNVVRRMLEINPRRTDQEISELCGVSDRTVANQRKHVPGALTDERQGRDGKRKTAKGQTEDSKEGKRSEDNSDTESDSQDGEKADTPEALEGEVDSSDGNGDTSEMDSIVCYSTEEEPDVTKTDPVPRHTPDELQMSILALENVCRMQAREFDRRANFVQKLQSREYFTEVELEMLSCLAKDMDALEPIDSVEWYERTIDMRAVCLLLSEILATAGKQD